MASIVSTGWQRHETASTANGASEKKKDAKKRGEGKLRFKQATDQLQLTADCVIKQNVPGFLFIENCEGNIFFIIIFQRPIPLLILLKSQFVQAHYSYSSGKLNIMTQRGYKERNRTELEICFPEKQHLPLMYESINRETETIAWRHFPWLSLTSAG